MMEKLQLKIRMNEEIAPKIYKIIFLATEIVKKAKAGQFINLYCNKGELLLPRPISICEVNKKTGEITLVYAVVGKGTEIISTMKSGDTIEAIGPLGNGFSVDEEVKQHLIIAGGIGVPPMVELVKFLKGNITVYLGFRCNPILVETIKQYGATVYVATEDGSVGIKGNVMDLINQHNPVAEMIYSCGPKPMLKAVAEWSEKLKIPAQLSLEERMACGIGACLVCTCKTKKEQDWENKRVCKDGPVFWRDEVIWHD